MHWWRRATHIKRGSHQERLQVLHCRHPGSDVLAALVKVAPDPLRTSQREPCMFAWTLARQTDADDEHEGAWMTDSVQVVPVAFLNAWPRARP